MTITAFVAEAISIIYSGVTGVATALGAGLQSLVTSLAFTGTGETQTMSAFMGVVLAFAGISLAIALGRWVVNLLASLGQRNR